MPTASENLATTAAALIAENAGQAQQIVTLTTANDTKSKLIIAQQARINELEAELAAGTPPVPPTTAKPDATNTGPTGTLKASGSVSAVAGKVIENLSIKGTIDAKGLAPIIRNCRIDAGGANLAIKNANGVTVENCELTNYVTAAIDATKITVRKCHIHDAEQDGLKVGDNSEITGNFITRLGTAVGSHADAIQIRGGQNIKITGNNFATDSGAGFNSNSPVFIQGGPNAKPAINITIDGNWIAGGNYGVRPVTDGGDPASLKVTNNTFKLGTFRYGCGSIEKGVIWTGNVDEAGKPVLPGTK